MTASGRQLVFNTGADRLKIRLPSAEELASGLWKQANWTGPAYDTARPRSYNKQLLLPPSALSRTVTSGVLPPYTGYHVIQLLATHYPDGSTLAADLQLYVRTVSQDATVTHDPFRGTLLFTSTVPLRFPTDRELRDPAWRLANWHGAEYGADPLDFSRPAISARVLLRARSTSLPIASSTWRVI